MINIEAIAASFARWSDDGVVIAAAATKLYAIYQQLEPTAKESIAADVQAIEASWTALDDALNAYDSANSLSRLTAAIAVGNTIAKLAPLVGRIAKDGQTLFASDWSVIQPQVMIIIHTLEGTPA